MSSNKVSLISFVTSSAILVFLAGFLVRDFKLFPYPYYAKAMQGFQKIREDALGKLPIYYQRIDKPFPEISNPQPYEGLNLVTKMTTDDNLTAEIIDAQGKVVHRWNINWFELWPNPDHVPENIRPKETPGTQIHGAVIMENGDLVFNFDYFGLIRIDRQGKVVWRLPYMTHHSLHRHDDGNLWVAGRRYHTERTPELPHLKPPIYEETLLEVSPEGKILREWSVPKILRKNGYSALLYQTPFKDFALFLDEGSGKDRNDLLHMNDVEPFPLTMKEGFFKRGDVMLSLRNINSVIVFNAETEEIKTVITRDFIQHHDPDFIDGDTISVFDNNRNNALDPADSKSRIWLISLKDNTQKVIFEGSKEKPFYTLAMGKNQWLPNGNLLITESVSGRAFEIDKDGNIIWQYVNYVDKENNIVGIISEVQRLPIEYTKLFVNQP
jgi:hypothetical protein